MPEFENHSKTAALMLEMSKQIHNTDNVVTMDSGSCVTVGILECHDAGVFGQSMIQKQGQFWPKHVLGDQIDMYMKDKPMGHAITLKQCIDQKKPFDSLSK